MGKFGLMKPSTYPQVEDTMKAMKDLFKWMSSIIINQDIGYYVGHKCIDSFLTSNNILSLHAIISCLFTSSLIRSVLFRVKNVNFIDVL